MTLDDLPALNATLNGTAAALLTAGYVSIRRGQVARHRACMLAAFAASILFLVSYLVYHAQAGAKLFPGTGAVRAVYLGILVTHTVLAALVPPMAIVTLWRALKERFDRHARLARWTLPVWLYVSVTGVVIYVMLYRITWH
jgi:putative membrane protein